MVIAYGVPRLNNVIAWAVWLKQYYFLMTGIHVIRFHMKVTCTTACLISGVMTSDLVIPPDSCQSPYLWGMFTIYVQVVIFVFTMSVHLLQWWPKYTFTLLKYSNIFLCISCVNWVFIYYSVPEKKHVAQINCGWLQYILIFWHHHVWIPFSLGRFNGHHLQ